MTKRYEDNVPGKWYTNTDCITCSLCESLAPDCFKLADDGDHDVVHKQPENQFEEEACVEARDSCPVGAIKDDGESL